MSAAIAHRQTQSQSGRTGHHLGNAAQISTISSPIVRLHHGKPVTDSLAISREFGRRHDNVLQSLDNLIADCTISRLEFKEVTYSDAKGEARRMIELTERGALISMPFIGGKNSRAGQVRLVDAFLAMRDQLAGQPEQWTDARQQVAASFRVMTDAILVTRSDDGKSTLPHHYMAEAKLLNWVLTGKFESLDRNQLAEPELELLEALETRNGILIARGRTYAERKKALPAFAQEWMSIKAGRIAQ